MADYYTYFLRCGDGTLYAGTTTNPARRLRQHRGEQPGGAKYTAAHRVDDFAALWKAPNKSAAYQLEYRLKQLTRQQKLAWISGEADDALLQEGFERQKLS